MRVRSIRVVVSASRTRVSSREAVRRPLAVRQVRPRRRPACLPPRSRTRGTPRPAARPATQLPPWTLRAPARGPAPLTPPKTGRMFVVRSVRCCCDRVSPKRGTVSASFSPSRTVAAAPRSVRGLADDRAICRGSSAHLHGHVGYPRFQPPPVLSPGRHVVCLARIGVASQLPTAGIGGENSQSRHRIAGNRVCPRSAVRRLLPRERAAIHRQTPAFVVRVTPVPLVTGRPERPVARVDRATVVEVDIGVVVASARLQRRAAATWFGRIQHLDRDPFRERCSSPRILPDVVAVGAAGSRGPSCCRHTRRMAGPAGLCGTLIWVLRQRPRLFAAWTRPCSPRRRSTCSDLAPGSRACRDAATFSTAPSSSDRDRGRPGRGSCR